MTNFDPASPDKIFSQLTSDLPAIEVLALARDGVRMMVDTNMGEQFREELLDIYAQAQLDLRTLNATTNIAKLLDDYIFAATEITTGDTIAVHGVGIVMIGGKNDKPTPEFVTPSKVLFGEVAGGGHGPYDHARSKDIIAYEQDIIEDLPTTDRTSAFVVLHDAVICERNDPGWVQTHSQLAYVPVADRSLRLGRAYPLAS